MTRSLPPSATPGCPELTHTSHCPAHTHHGWRHDKTASARGYGSAWRKLRARTLRAEPTCRTCGAPATTVDHITPKHLGGDDTPTNLQSLCDSCHASKTEQEKQAAQARSRNTATCPLPNGLDASPSTPPTQ